MSVPSNATPMGPFATGNVPNTMPSLARSLVTALLPPALFVTQILAPSNAKSNKDPDPAAKAPSTVPSLARSLVTELLEPFAIQMFAPSKATPLGLCPTAKLVVRLAGYHRSRATCSGLGGVRPGGPVGPCGPVAPVGP